MIEIIHYGIYIMLGSWYFRLYIGPYEFCMFRLKLMSRDLYDTSVAIIEVAFTWLSIEIGYNETEQ